MLMYYIGNIGSENDASSFFFILSLSCCVSLPFVWKWSSSVGSDSLEPRGHQTPSSVGFSRQEYWNGLPFPSPGNLPDPGVEPRSPTLLTDALLSEPPGRVPFVYTSLNFL